MIDLISHGLELRKKLIISSGDNPQVIRNVSAGPIRYLTTYSARSAESAAMSKNNLEYGSESKSKVGMVADSADLAERESRQPHVIADELRKHCGLNATTITKPPKDSLKTVACNDCEHFSPDEIGDGVGIGHCALGIRSTKIAGYITMPLYRYSDRYCDKFSKLME
ncbi:MAG: hypothetical protein WC627_12870 [Legionella sp.]